jgi:uncharacterized protein (DUF952 family)
MAMIVHICKRQDWDAAQENGTYTPDSLNESGFIHCSRPEQVVSVANEFYSKQSGLVLLWIDPGVVKAEIRWEASVGFPLAGNQPPADVFPHINGALNLDAVSSVSDFFPDDDGVFRSLPKHEYHQYKEKNCPGSGARR